MPYSRFRRVQVSRFSSNGRERYGILKTLRIWSKNGHTTSHNWQCKVDELERIVTEFPELETKEIAEFLATKVTT